MNKEKTVYSITVNNMCIGCGVCSAVCPMAAILMEKEKDGYYRPQIIQEKCVSCGNCLRVCSSKDGECFSSVNLNDSKNYLAYSAFSKDESIRKNSASGGVATAIVHCLLTSGIYDDAMVVNSVCKDDIKQAKSYVETVDKKKTQKSRYLPVSQELTARTMISNRGKRLIIIATPCCIKALLNVIDMYSLNRDNYLFLGLFCEGTLSYNIIEYFQEIFSKSMRISEVMFKDKRSGGWPGNVGLICKNGTIKYLPRTERLDVKRFFTLERCNYCTMKLNPFSDIAVGDDYIKGEETEEGCSSVIINTSRGQMAWDSVAEELEILASSYKKVYESQKVDKKSANLQYVSLKRFIYKDNFQWAMNGIRPGIKVWLKYRLLMYYGRLGIRRRNVLIQFIVKVKRLIKHIVRSRLSYKE